VNKVASVATGTALVAVLGFIQMEIQVVHDDVQEIKTFLLHTSDRMRYTSADAQCLAKNIYHEAGIEPIEGKFAVAQVTLNRLKEGRWGNSICDVVLARKQFSWTNSKKKLHEKPRGPLWDESVMVTKAVLDQGVRVPSLMQSTYYHAEYVNPLWAKSVAKIQQVGQHIFYKKT
jgi:spore germination cell wall hydrolase CwlJ-like protein